MPRAMVRLAPGESGLSSGRTAQRTKVPDVEARQGSTGVMDLASTLRARLLAGWVGLPPGAFRWLRAGAGLRVIHLTQLGPVPCDAARVSARSSACSQSLPFESRD